MATTGLGRRGSGKGNSRPDRPGRRGRRGDAGQVVVFVAIVGLVLAISALVLLAGLGGLAHDRARARTAADASALAAAAEGEAGATAIASANGGVLEAFVMMGDDAEVTVRVGRARASARATRSWQPSHQKGHTAGR